MKRESDPKGGGNKDKQSINARTFSRREDNLPIDETKQPKRSAPKTNKPARGSSLRAKTNPPWIKPSVKASTQRVPNSTTGSSRPGARAGIPDFSLHGPTVHPRLWEQRGRLTKSPVQKSSSPGKTGTINRQVAAENHNSVAQTTLDTAPDYLNSYAISSSSNVGQREQAEAELANSAPSQLGGLEIHMHKVADRLIARKRAITQRKLVERKTMHTIPIPIPTAITTSTTCHQVQAEERHLGANFDKIMARTENEAPPATPRSILKDVQPVRTILSDRPNRNEPSARVGEGSATDFESKMRALMTPYNRGRSSRKNTHHTSIKSVKWDPAIICMGPVTPPTATDNDNNQSEAKDAETSLENDLKNFIHAIKGMERGKPKLVDQLLEALRDLKSDNGSDTKAAGTEVQPKSDDVVLQSSLPAEEKVTCKHPALEGTPSNTAATRDQQSYRDVLIAGLPKKSGGMEKTLDDGCSAPSLHLIKKLNPEAPAFASIRQKTQTETRTDELAEKYQPISAIQTEQQSQDGGHGSKQEIRMDAKVGKYVPPALRGDRNLNLPTKKPQEPVWIKMDDAPPMKYTEPAANDAEICRSLKQLSAGYEDIHAQNEWIRKWLHDAAKPYHGLGIQHPADHMHATNDMESGYRHVMDDIAFSTSVHEDYIPYAFSQLPEQQMQWGPSNPHLVQYPNLHAGYTMFPYSLVGPLIPVPPPPFLLDQTYQHDPAMQQLPAPLIPMNAANTQGALKVRHSKEDSAARIARSLDPIWGDRVLDQFTLKFPMTGKAQSHFPVPPIQDLENQAAQIQQRLELLILHDKEKKASEKWFQTCKQNSVGRIPSLSTSLSENLIKFD
jgi:hypothetical protein